MEALAHIKRARYQHGAADVLGGVSRKHETPLAGELHSQERQADRRKNQDDG
jgi:hypothetical protein